MAISANRIRPFKNGCIDRSNWPDFLARKDDGSTSGKTKQPIFDVQSRAKVVTPDELQQILRSSPNNRIEEFLEPAPKVIRISLRKIIQQLRSIARSIPDKSMGFHPIELADEFEKALRKKAISLAKSLKKPEGIPPDTKDLQKAMTLIGAYEIIKPLRIFIKAKDHEHFGFHPQAQPEEDKLFVEKAKALCFELLDNPDDFVLETAMGFMETVGVISVLENVISEKIERGTFGLKPVITKVSTEEKLIGDTAKELVRALKKQPTGEVREIAYNFLTMLDQLETGKKIERRENRIVKPSYDLHYSQHLN